jgi:MYXO-CTERM domain-containing protein
VTQNQPNFQVETCTSTEVHARILGPTTFTVDGKTFTVEGVVPNAPNDFSYTMPQFPVFGNGVELTAEQHETDPSKKIVDYQYGDITGYEGTKVRKWVPAELNPNKSSGEIRIVATTTLEGLQRKYIADGCDKTQLTTCTPNEEYGNAGEIPAGVTRYKDMITGQVYENPGDINVVPPLQEASKDDGGCSVSGHVGSTRNDLALLFAGLGLAAVMRRRKQD